mmetsp:Transcript_2375/g.8733  ORF Transcript_2375/g.8733 Transcript_2375/m.8733 type:complete len:266 (-) Transcript_2375:335-1132(-)
MPPYGVGVAIALRAGVRIGTYDAGGSRILYPSCGNIASRSSSLSGRFRSSTSRSHLYALYCSGVIGTACCNWPGAGVSIGPGPNGVCMPAPNGVAPPPTIGVAPGGRPPGTLAGVSSQRDRCFFGVSPTASQLPGVAPTASARGVSSHRLRRPGVASTVPRAAVGVGASHLLTLTGASAAAPSHSLAGCCSMRAFFAAGSSADEEEGGPAAAAPESQRLRRPLLVAGAGAGAATPEAPVGRAASSRAAAAAASSLRCSASSLCFA